LFGQLPIVGYGKLEEIREIAKNDPNEKIEFQLKLDQADKIAF
jgi:hypothetical protein